MPDLPESRDDRPAASEAEAAVEIEELEVEGRVRLVAWNLQVSEENTHAEVELQHGDRVALGRADRPGAGASPELLAQAALDALESLCRGRVALRLAGAEGGRIGGQAVFLVRVIEAEGRTERQLFGAADAQADPQRAGVYAVLHAMNRRLGRILAEPPRDYEIPPSSEA